MKREVYLDNSATTRAYQEVAEKMQEVLCRSYGNPSSLHRKGLEAEHEIREAKRILAKLWKAEEKEVFFTSGGTEGDNLAIIGAAKAGRRRGSHLITSCVEHPAVLQAMAALEEEGFSVTYLPTDPKGKISLAQLEEALTEETVLVSLMHVNNEIGTVQPVEEAGRLIKQKCPETLFHVDAVQSYGKYELFPKSEKIDLCSVSGHKIHGPKGVGALYIKNGVKLRPLLYGGGQQKDIRPGTENVPAIAGLGVAAQKIYEGRKSKTEKMRKLKSRLSEGIKSLPDTVLHGGEGEESAPHIVSAGFKGVKSEVILHALEEQGIFVSSGSACASNHPRISSVLKAIGAKAEYRESTLRFSLSEFTTEEEIDYTLENLYNIIPMLRRYTRR